MIEQASEIACDLRAMSPREAGLDALDLAENRLRSVPRGVWDLSALTMLDLGHNAIGEIPDDAGRLERLRFLYLAENSLGRLPEGIGGLKERGAPRGAGDHAPWFVARSEDKKRVRLNVRMRDGIETIRDVVAHVPGARIAWFMATQPP